MNRRFFGGAAMLAATALTSMARAQETQTKAAAKQVDYLFWLGEQDRLSLKSAANSVLLELDGMPLDARRIAGIYQRSALIARKKSTEAVFVNRILKYRDGLGAVRERASQSVEGGFKFLPNFPEGQFAIVAVDTMFATTPIIFTEQLTFVRDLAQSPQWSFVDYYLATKPFYSY